MAYEMVMPYHLHMPSYFLETFTEYPKFAKDSDSELGKIKRAYQGQFSIEDRDANTPYIKRIRVVTTIDYSLED